MVDEFSAFARMPAPVLRNEALDALCRETLMLYRSAHQDIRFVASLPDEPATVWCDHRQVRQALTNLVQNAIESIEARRETDLRPGIVRLAVLHRQGQVELHVEDNGKGLPKDVRHRLTEPYVTTREKGTGLGLAIVKKIMEDHGGDLVIEDRRRSGARVRLIFPGRDVISGHNGKSSTEAETARSPDSGQGSGPGSGDDTPELAVIHGA